MRLTFVDGPMNVGPFDLQDGPNLIGRDIICRVHLPGRQVSRQHAVIHVEKGRVRIEDTGTPNALLDGAGKRTTYLVMQDGDRVQIGEYVLQLEDEELELEEEERTNTRSSRRPSPPPRPQYSRDQGTFPTLLPIPPEPETETELSLDEDMELELSLDTEHTNTHSSRPATPPPRPNLALPRPAPKPSAAPVPAGPPKTPPVVSPRPIVAPAPVAASIPDPVATPAPMSPPPRAPAQEAAAPARGPVPIASPMAAPIPPAQASPAINPAPRPPSTLVSPPVSVAAQPPDTAPKADIPITAPGIWPARSPNARPAPAPISPSARVPQPASPPPPATPVLRPAAKSSFPPPPQPASTSAGQPPAAPAPQGSAGLPVADPTGEPESSGTSWTTPPLDSARPAVARLVPRPSSRNERPGPAAAPRPDSHLDDEPSDSGIPWLLQLISGLALILGLWLATPGGGSLALVNSAYEGGKKISAEHAEAVLVGLAETNAVRLRQGLAASVDPFDNMPGVQQVYVVDPSRRILVPESEKGIPLEGAERYLEKPIRFEGKTLGYIELAYDPGVLVHRSWSPLLHGMLALTVAGLGSCVMVLVGWLLLVRPWMRLAHALETGGSLPSPNGFRPMERVAGWLRRHR